MIIFSHKIDIFGTDLLVGVGVKNAKQLDAWLKKYAIKSAKNIITKEVAKDLDEALSSTLAGFLYVIENKDKYRYYFIFLKEFKFSSYHYDVLLHELIHYKQEQWKNRLIKDSEIEFEAYFIEMLFKQVRNILLKKLKLCGKK